MRRGLFTIAGLAMALTATPAVAQQLAVDESAVARDVQDRAPVGQATAFGSDVGRLYCWTRVSGAEGSAAIHHVWIYNGEEVADVELNVNGSPWRTWSSKNIPDWAVGEWSVEVRDAAGNVLQTLTFTVS